MKFKHIQWLFVWFFAMLTGLLVVNSALAESGQAGPINFERPELRGMPLVGRTLTVWRGLWQNADALTFSYEWQMAWDQQGLGLQTIKDARGASIRSEHCVLPLAARARYVRVKVTARYASSSRSASTVYSRFSDTWRVNAAPADFDGDGLSDLWFFDATRGKFNVYLHSQKAAFALFGYNGCQFIPADFDGDGLVDPAAYDETSGLWGAMLSSHGYMLVLLSFGGPGYTAVPADYDGDGLADPAIYHAGTGRLTAQLSRSGYQLASCDIGGVGHMPVTGDFDGDRFADPATYEPATGLWSVLLSSWGYFQIQQQFGGADYWPIPADYDDDGKADLALYNWTQNKCWALLSQTGAVVDRSLLPRNVSGFPLPGYYSYDLPCTPAILSRSGDFLLWYLVDIARGYRGHSFQFSQDRWRVSW